MARIQGSFCVYEAFFVGARAINRWDGCPYPYRSCEKFIYFLNFKSVQKLYKQQNICQKSSFFVSENENLKKIIQIYVLQSQKCWGDKR